MLCGYLVQIQHQDTQGKKKKKKILPKKWTLSSLASVK